MNRAQFRRLVIALTWALFVVGVLVLLWSIVDRYGVLWWFGAGCLAASVVLLVVERQLR